MLRLKPISATILGLSLALPISAIAQTDEQTGPLKSLLTLEQLPLGQLRSQLENLPLISQIKALRWLSSFSFPESDYDALRVDSGGGVFYADTQLPEQAPPASANAEIAQISAADVFTLHSKPGASKVIYIDVDGHTITGTAWNSNAADPLYAKAYDTDNNPDSFSAAERNAIAEMWHRIAEDYAGFDVDVTTEEPLVFNSQTGRLLITDDVDTNGNAMPANGAGGVAYVGVFGNGNYHTQYSPALVYANNLGPDFPPYIAEAATHEMGHNLGLSHDGTATSSYYGGHGSGATTWGAIMGGSYGLNVTQWSRGEYSGANNNQDDIAIIADKLAFGADDHGDTLGSASLLSVSSDGNVTPSNPESDPHNSQASNKGIIESASDVDVFAFNASAGSLELTVTPAWAAYYRSSNGRGANLDIQATLLDNSGNIIASSNPTSETNASISANLSQGLYHLQVAGVGNSSSPYPDYGSLGMYFISGTVPSGPPDVDAPNPDPMGWDDLPSANSAYGIGMTANTAVDDGGSAVQYYFECVSGNNCSDSGWQYDTTFNASGLAEGSSYSWRVKARDVSGNETGYSSTESATTPVAPKAPNAPSSLSVSDSTNGEALLSWSDNSNNEDRFEIVRETYSSSFFFGGSWGSTTTAATTSANATSYTDNTGSGNYRYRLSAANAVGSSASTGWVEVDVTEGSSGGSCGFFGCGGFFGGLFGF